MQHCVPFARKAKTRHSQLCWHHQDTWEGADDPLPGGCGTKCSYGRGWQDSKNNAGVQCGGGAAFPIPGLLARAWWGVLSGAGLPSLPPHCDPYLCGHGPRCAGWQGLFRLCLWVLRNNAELLCVERLGYEWGGANQRRCSNSKQKPLPALVAGGGLLVSPEFCVTHYHYQVLATNGLPLFLYIVGLYISVLTSGQIKLFLSLPIAASDSVALSALGGTSPKAPSVCPYG